jgi:WD40 repeat protein
MENTTPRLNPFVGPRSFRTGETLYGRDRELNELLDLLIAERVVLLYAPSGAGKSSLVQAALVPRLGEEGFRVLPVMRVSQEPPTSVAHNTGFNRYVFSLLLSLEEALPEKEQLPLSELAGMTLPAYLDRRAAAKTADQPKCDVLILDQFEEILTVNPADLDTKIEFFTQVGQALRDRNRWALFAMREDYIAGLDRYLRPIPTRLTNRFRLDMLEEAAARSAMQQPAGRIGVDFTDAAARKLANDLRKVRVQRADGSAEEQLGLYVEPVQLQVVCYRLWDRLPADAQQIVEADVVAVGNVDSALSDYYAERVVSAARDTGVSERAIRDWVEQQLITVQGIRGQVLQGPDQGLDSRAVQKLLDAYLVRAEKRRGATWLELAHDRLIAPVQANNAEWRDANLSTLQRQAALWEKQNRPDGLLLRDRALSDAEAWAEAHRADLTSIEQDYLSACRKARAAAQRERRNNRLIKGLAVVAVIIALVAIVLGLIARQQANLALAGRLDSQASAVPATRLDRQLLLRVLANEFASTSPVSEDLQASLKKTAVLHFLRGHDGSINALAFSPKTDQMILASGGQDHTVRLWDVKQGTPISNPLTGHTDQVRALAFNPVDGQLLASTGDDARLFLWNSEAHQPVQQVQLGAPGQSLAFSPNGKVLAVGQGDGSIDLRDAVSLELIGSPLKGHAGPVLSLAFNYDGTQLYSGGQDSKIKAWDVTKGELKNETQAAGQVVALAAVGEFLVSGDANYGVELWNGNSLQEVQSAPVSPRGRPLFVGFDSDEYGNTTLMYTDSNNDLSGWNWQGNTITQPLLGYEGPISSAAFIRNEAYGPTYASSLDDTIQIWGMRPAAAVTTGTGLDPQQLAEEACQRAGRNLSQEEWNMYMPGVRYQKICEALPTGK